MKTRWLSILHLLVSCTFLMSLTNQSAAQNDPLKSYLLRPDRIFDGHELVETRDAVVLVTGNTIVAIGSEREISIPRIVEEIDLSGMTLLPGLIEGHSHLLLHPYNETDWNDQVLRESLTERVARATVHAENTLLAGFTTVRDLGTEGAGYADVGLKQAIEKGVIPGPRILTTTRAIVATGSYGPTGFDPSFDVPLGAEEADGHDELIRVVRDQIGKGADWIKVYADYRWGANGEARPTFSEDELRLIVETAASSGRFVVAHASTAEGMRRATVAGVKTIEHGDGGTQDVFRLMAANGVAFCPTIAAGYAISQYGGWNPDSDPEPARVAAKRASFQLALSTGVSMCMGGDVGVYTHGTNAMEMELMAEYGMEPLQVLVAATSGNATYFGMEDQLGSISPGLRADLIAVRGNPVDDLGVLRTPGFVMKDGVVYVDSVDE